MTIKGVIEGIANWIGVTLSRISAFIDSDEFDKLCRKLVTWVEPAVLWFGEVIAGIVVVVARFVKSDNFKDAVSRGRELVILAYSQALRGCEWIGRWLYAIVTSEFVNTGIETAADLFYLCLPKPRQQLIALVSVLFIVIVLVWSVPESERTEKIPETTSIESIPAPPSIDTGPEIKRIVSGLPEFREIPAGRERKAAFFGYFLPIVETQNRSILTTRQKLADWYLSRDEISSEDASEINTIAIRYRVHDFDVGSNENWQQLLNRVDVVPPSLALAQAANESAWGTSRFAREALNFFGQWCFKQGCGLVPKKREPGKTHEVAAFDSPQESVKMYIRNLNSNSAYKPLRDVRAQLRQLNKPVTGHALAAGLNRYSERGQEYVSELRSMIEYNKLARYDVF